VCGYDKLVQMSWLRYTLVPFCMY